MAGARHCRGPGRSRVGPREERHPSCPGQACRAPGSLGQRHLVPRASAVWPPRRLVPRLHPERWGWAAGSEPVPFLPALNLPYFKHFDWQS